MEHLCWSVRIHTYSSHKSINKVVVNLDGVFCREIKFSAGILHNENKTFVFAVYNFVLSILNNVKFV
jgi:hypothetical protein